MSDSDDRIIATIGMMNATTSAGDGEGVNAYRQATRLLEARGMTWRDVAMMAFGNGRRWTPPPPPPAPASKPQPSPTPSPEAAERPRTKERLGGSSIPVSVMGVLRLHEDDTKARKNQFVLLDVETDQFIYGPLIAYAGTLMDNVLRNRGKRALLRIRPERAGRQMPQVVGCSPV